MSGPAGRLSVVIPASNEAGRIGACLHALLAQEGVAEPVEVIVVANGCRDDTAAVARADLYKRRAVAILLPKEMTADQAGTHPATLPSA